MTGSRLKVIFLWHMHQPDYRDPRGGPALLPWVRLHGVKDYLDMVTILDGFPRIRDRPRRTHGARGAEETKKMVYKAKPNERWCESQ